MLLGLNRISRTRFITHVVGLCAVRGYVIDREIYSGPGSMAPAIKTRITMRTHSTSKGYTVPETTTTPVVSNTTAAVNRAAKAAGVTAAAVSEALPTVVETVDVVATVPAKVVLNQKLVVVTAVVGGAALGAGILFGIQKLKARKETKELEKKLQHHNEASVRTNTKNNGTDSDKS